MQLAQYGGSQIPRIPRQITAQFFDHTATQCLVCSKTATRRSYVLLDMTSRRNSPKEIQGRFRLTSSYRLTPIPTADISSCAGKTKSNLTPHVFLPKSLGSS